MPYSNSERQVQRRAGEVELAERAAGGIRSAIPPVAADFLASQPFIVVAAPDDEDRMWATVLTGPPGFSRATDERTVVVNAMPMPGDATASALRRVSPVGTIAVEPSTRRRMRINGRSAPEPAGIRIDVEEVIGNCPKYIQKRTILTTHDRAAPAQPTRSRSLTEAQGALLHATDTFFFATSSSDGKVDASHRGGNPGFVHVIDDRHLIWPDYKGNSMFLTLGNLATNPSAGVTVVDWGSGSVLQLTGTATTIWGEPDLRKFPGAQRLISYELNEAVEVPGAMGMAWSEPEFSKFNPGSVSG